MLPATMATGGGLKLVVFDFDQTLSVYHVFKALAGWRLNNRGAFVVPPPYATSEKGQLRRILELNSEGFAQEAGGFARAAFGSESRIEELRDCMRGLRESGSEVIVCTKGLVGVAKKCLVDVKLLTYIDEVYGNVGDSYGMQQYDRSTETDDLGPASAFLGRPEQANFGSKDSLIAQLMREKKLQHDQCVLVEDDEEEIRRAKPVCRTLFVEEAQGVTTHHMASLLSMARGQEQPSDVRSRRGWWCCVL